LDASTIEYTSKFARQYGISFIVPKIKESSEYTSGKQFRLRDIATRILNELLTQEQQNKLVSNNDGSLKYTFENVSKFYAGRYARDTPTDFIALNKGLYRATLEGEVEEQLDEEISADDSDAGYIYAFTYQNYISKEDYPIKIGKTINDVEKRVSDQFKGSAMPEPPIILGKWNSSEFNHLERAIHAVLKVRGKWITEASGIEWFRTSLAEIQLIIDFIGKK
jgi:hypothetical protein